MNAKSSVNHETPPSLPINFSQILVCYKISSSGSFSYPFLPATFVRRKEAPWVDQLRSLIHGAARNARHEWEGGVVGVSRLASIRLTSASCVPVLSAYRSSGHESNRFALNYVG